MLQIDRNLAGQAFRDYAAGYDIDNVKIRLKAEHTGRVAAFCDRIAKSIGSTEYDADLAWLIGMLHDVGRFEQLRRYNTFFDAASIDHAEFGADLLFQEGLIRKFLNDPQNEDPDLKVIERAVRYHSRFELPEDLTERERIFADILRDADKVDIIRVNVEFSFESIYDTPPEELKQLRITPEVKAASLSHKTILRSLRKNTLDAVVSQLSLVYGLVFPESRRLVKEQGYLEKLMIFRTGNPEADSDFDIVTDEIKNWTDRNEKE